MMRGRGDVALRYGPRLRLTCEQCDVNFATNGCPKYACNGELTCCTASLQLACTASGHSHLP